VHVAFDSDPATTTAIDFLGYAYAVTASDVSGTRWISYDERTPQTWQVPLVAGVRPTATVTAPTAYVVLPGFAEPVGAVLRAHGVTFDVLQQLRATLARRYRATTATFSVGPYEGRQTLKLQGAWLPATTAELPRGSLVVPVAQARGRLVIELFEPEARESLVGWGFMNARFEQKEYMEGYVAEEVARELLQDPTVKAAFAERLKDAAFASDPKARLDFFYRRHPSYDVEKDTLPVLRLD
jgi:hypothetical protein